VTTQRTAPGQTLAGPTPSARATPSISPALALQIHHPIVLQFLLEKCVIFFLHFTRRWPLLPPSMPTCQVSVLLRVKPWQAQPHLHGPRPKPHLHCPTGSTTYHCTACLAFPDMHARSFPRLSTHASSAYSTLTEARNLQRDSESKPWLAHPNPVSMGHALLLVVGIPKIASLQAISANLRSLFFGRPHMQRPTQFPTSHCLSCFSDIVIESSCPLGEHAPISPVCAPVRAQHTPPRQTQGRRHGPKACP
jgi:hypothetical protein